MKPDPIEKLRLQAYPNPEREGCPGSTAIHAMANRGVPRGDPKWEHIWHCSPCFSEFKTLRDARRAEKLKHQYIWTAAAIIIMSIGAAFLWKALSRQHPLQTAANETNHKGGGIGGTLDFKSRTAERDASGADEKDQVLPRSTQDLEVILPVGSDPGTYVLEILSPSRMNDPLERYTGTASSGAQGLVRLRVHVNLSSLRRGHYVAAWHSLRTGSWDYGRVIIQ